VVIVDIAAGRGGVGASERGGLSARALFVFTCSLLIPDYCHPCITIPRSGCCEKYIDSGHAGTDICPGCVANRLDFVEHTTDKITGGDICTGS
jgi:hypothetical protein